MYVTYATRNHSQSCHFLCQNATGVTHWNMFSSTLPMCKCLWSCKKSKPNTAAHKSGYYTFTLKNYSYKCKQSRTDSAVTGPPPPKKNTSQNIQVLTEQKLNANDIRLFCPYKSLRCLPQQNGLSNLLYFPKKHFNAWRWNFYGDARKLSITHSISSTCYIVGGSCLLWSTGLMVYHFPQHSSGSPAGWEECQTLPPKLLSDLWQVEITALNIFPQRKDAETKRHW